MNPCRLTNATRSLGAPTNWNPETDGECGSLDIADTPFGDGGNAMISLWEPTPDELAALNAGAKVNLQVIGLAHPPVALWVDEPPAVKAWADEVQGDMA